MEDMILELLNIYKEQKNDAYYLTYIVPSYNKRLNNVLHSSCEMLIECMFVKKQGKVYKHKESILEYIHPSKSKVSAKVFYLDIYKAFYELAKDAESLGKIIENLTKGISDSSEDTKSILAKVLIMNLISSS